MKFADQIPSPCPLSNEGLSLYTHRFRGDESLVGDDQGTDDAAMAAVSIAPSQAEALGFLANTSIAEQNFGNAKGHQRRKKQINTNHKHT